MIDRLAQGISPNLTAADLAVSVSHSSVVNSALTNFTFVMSQASPFTSDSVVEIVFPTSITPQGNFTTDGSLVSLNSILTDKTLTVSLPSTMSNNSFTIVVSNVKNAPSLKTSSSFKITTRTTTGFSYATSDTKTIINTQASRCNISAQFSPQTLNTATQMTIQINLTSSSIAYMVIQLAPTFAINGLSYQSTFPLTPNYSGSTINISSTDFTTSQMSITISGFTSPSIVPSDSTTIRTYDSSGFIVDENLNTINYTTSCTFPCKTCTTNPSNCLTCYTFGT